MAQRRGNPGGARRRLAVPLLIVTVLLLAATTAAGAERDGEPSAGRAVFETHCAACHGDQAQGRGAAPALTGVVDRLGAQTVADVVRDGRGGMPAFGNRLDAQEVADLVAYLDSTAERADTRPRHRDGPMMRGDWRDRLAGTSPLQLLGVLLVAAIGALALVGLLVRWARPGDAQTPNEPSPRETLDRRYARGELTREEYLAARDDLEDPRGPG